MSTTKLRKSNPAAVRSTRASERHLAGGQHSLSDARPESPEAAGRRRVRFVQSPYQVAARPGERWGGAEEKTGPDRQGGRECEHGSVDTDLVESGHAARNHRGRGAHDRGGHGEAQHTTGKAEDDALGKQLAEQFGRSPRRGRRGWASSRRRAIPRESSRAGHIGARHQEHQPVAAASIRSAGRKRRPRSSRNELTRVSSATLRRPTPLICGMVEDPVRAVDGIGVREDPAELRCCAQQREERGAHRRCGKVGRPVRPVQRTTGICE